MKQVYIVADNLTTPLGFTTAENLHQLTMGNSGISEWNDFAGDSSRLFAARMKQGWGDEYVSQIKNPADFTALEQLFLWSIHESLRQTDVSLSDERTLLILSTTKGNIDLLNGENAPDHPRLYLGAMGKWLMQELGCVNTPMIVSNACISGVLSILIGARMIRSGQYDHVVIAGGDLVSPFVVSGFQSFKAISSTPCKPYDLNRTGISLGEGCGTIVLSNEKPSGDPPTIEVLHGASSNDSNHISGPSRTGEGLLLAIERAFSYSALSPHDIDHISTHGTATLYNDEMEAKAISQAEMEHIPVSSLKGYFGHTLGAAGVIESIVSIHSLKKNHLFANLGYEEHGVSTPINIIRQHTEVELNRCLKTASGFGGCNAAIIFSKS